MDAADFAGPLVDRYISDKLKQRAAHKETLSEIIARGDVICHDCGGEIERERVRALNLAGWPALRCIDCQRVHEERARTCK